MIKVLIVSVLVAYATAAISFSSGGLGSFGIGLGGGLGGGHGGGLGGGDHESGLGGGLGISLGGLGGGGGGGGHGHVYKDVDFYTVPHYEYKYVVNDPKHHDYHEQKEERYGDKVKGEYSLHEADGTIRIVKYEADKENGFNAIVERKGHAVHPQHYKTYGHH